MSSKFEHEIHIIVLVTKVVHEIRLYQSTQIILQYRCIYIRILKMFYKFGIWIWCLTSFKIWSLLACLLARSRNDWFKIQMNIQLNRKVHEGVIHKTRMCNLHVQVESSSMGSCMPEKGWTWFLSRRQPNQRISTLVHKIWLKKHPNSKTCSFCVGINVELLDYKRISLWWNAHVIRQDNSSYCRVVYGDQLTCRMKIDKFWICPAIANPVSYGMCIIYSYVHT